MGGRVTNFTWKSWFLAKKLKKIEKKKLKKIEKNASKASCGVPLTWLEHAQDMSRTCPGHAQDMAGHMRTHMGFIKLKIGPKPPRYRHFEESKIIKNNQKKWKKCIKNESLVDYDMTWTCPGHAQDMLRTCWGHGMTLRVFKNSKSDQSLLIHNQ